MCTIHAAQGAAPFQITKKTCCVAPIEAARNIPSNAVLYAFPYAALLIGRRCYPVVPCAENTPLPNRKQSKQQRAKLFSVYLRPWTLIAAEATDITPYIADLDKVETATESHRDIRAAWKQY